MSFSNSQEDSCICMYAVPFKLKSSSNHDELIFEISISLAAVHKNPLRKTSPKIHQTTKKTFHYPCRPFVSSAPDEQRCIIRNIIQDLESPFPLENINWGLHFPDVSTPQNLDEIVSNKLFGIARRQCEENICDEFISIRIWKLQQVDPDEYQQLCTLPPRQHLDDWILENQGSVKFYRYLKFIYRLGRESPTDNKFYGLKSEIISSSSSSSCSICVKDFVKKSQAIRMPCSHIFHGFCLIKWLQINPSCPLCRSQLFTN